MQIEDDRETMPVYDESIFYPRENLRKLGFTDEDIADLVFFLRWQQEQRDLQEKGPKEKFIQVLRTRQNQLTHRRRLELLAELSGLENLAGKFLPLPNFTEGDLNFNLEFKSLSGFNYLIRR